ncbi:MAG: response regulator [Proteobacteria bacterium]|nr:response regulator [Pseudomonadota bacterium]
MNKKQALIVDDSKTAQYLLKRMLQQYDLHIDVASSAEEALAYLSYNHPAVIFLDQQMTGMTGFDALKTIKANPHTALIPVIMYSSQNDDLFVSQAIALGAQGILSKGGLQPANLQQVLERLNIRSQGEIAAPVVETSSPQPEEAATMSAAVPALVPATEVADIEKIRVQVGRLFEFHIADLKTHINNSTQFIIKRLTTSIDKASVREVNVGSNLLASVRSAVNSAALGARQQPQRLFLTPVLLALLLLGTGMLAYFVLQNQSDTQIASQKILAILEAKNVDRSMLAAPSSAAAMAPSDKPGDAAHAPVPVSQSLLQAVSWAQSADFHFDYGEQPLSGARLSNLNQLIYLLAEGGYRGPLVININFGNFCLEQDETGALRPARSDTRLAACKMQKDMTQRFSANDYITLPYQTFERTAAPLQDGRITLRLVTNGMNTPATEYPASTPQVTAGEWNRAALRNNRVSVQFPN